MQNVSIIYYNERNNNFQLDNCSCVNQSPLLNKNADLQIVSAPDSEVVLNSKLQQ